MQPVVHEQFRACHILQKMKIFEKMKKNTDIVLRNAILKHIYYYHFVEFGWVKMHL